MTRQKKKRVLTIALDRLDRHVPFFMSAVTAPEGIELKPLEIGLAEARAYRDGYDRHGRMFRDLEFDICEQSLASYIIARSRGDETLTASPVFPRRLFSQSCMFVNTSAGIDKPMDLIGKNVAINSLQTTLCVLARGDLKFEYGVSLEDIHWFVQREEELPLEGGHRGAVEPVPTGKQVDQMLLEGELDAYIHPSPSALMYARADRIRPLFADARDESIRYFRRYGCCPIMHLMVFPRRTVDRDPWLPRATIDMWNEAKDKARAYFDDPGYSSMFFYRDALKAEHIALGADPWVSGLAANRSNLERFMGYMVDQKLIDEPIPLTQLFHESVLDT
ncbi:MAG: taurine ABC transporter substrate-binding protein [Gammaproteobacteria bacterium]